MRQRSATLESVLAGSAPVLVIGMHRSGTSLVARLLRDAGIFLGYEVTGNCEPLELRRLNDRVLRRAGARWSEVRPLVREMGSPAFLEAQAALLRRALFERGGAERFFGPGAWRSILDGRPPRWGFKDPRSTVTFPIWLRLFPRARVVHVIRDGTAVAVSLLRRTREAKERWWTWWRYRFAGHRATLDPRRGFSLWEDHVAFALEHSHLVAEDRYLEIRYEDLLGRPEDELGRLLTALGQPLDGARLRAVCGRIDRGRLHPFRGADVPAPLAALAAASPWMRRLGYGGE